MMALIAEGFAVGVLGRLPDLSGFEMDGIATGLLSAGGAVTGEIAGTGLSMVAIGTLTAFFVPLALSWKVARIYGATAYAMAFLGGVSVVGSNAVGFLFFMGAAMLGLFSAFWK
jgi:hypothetical protein